MLGITNTSAISKFKSEACHLKCEECREHGLAPVAKGYALIKLVDINIYLKSCTYNVDKNKLMAELMSQSLADKLPDAKFKIDEDGAIDVDLTNEQIAIEEVQSHSDSEIQVLEQREILGKKFKFYGTYDKPLFLARDVAEVLQLKNVTDMISRVDEKEVSKLNLGGLKGVCNFLTEDGLYEVLMQSRKPIAKHFKIQVKEILNTIRKTGGYVAPSQESLFVDHYLSNLPSSTKKAIVESTANKNAELKVLRAQKYEKYRCIDTEIKMNETVMNQLEE